MEPYAPTAPPNSTSTEPRLFPQLRSSFLAIAILASLTACAGPAEEGDSQGDDRPASRELNAAAPADIEGRWRVVTIDGEPLPESLEDGKVPILVLTSQSAGGNLGCNSFSALSLYAGGRIAAHNWASELRVCAAVAEQEQTLSELLFEHPSVTRDGDELRIRSDNHEAVLAYLGPLEQARDNRPPQTIANTRWRISFVDRSEASTSPENRLLEFTDDQWRGLASCATLSGGYRREGNRLIVDDEIVSTEQNCPPKYAALDDAFAALMLSGPRYLVGPNGELILAGGGHRLTGGRSK